MGILLTALSTFWRLKKQVAYTSNPTSSLTIGLFKQIERQHRGDYSIHIIADNARYYRSVAVEEYLVKHPRIHLIFLPAYSPNLNLIERLWKYFRKTVLYNRYDEKFIQ